MLELAFEDTPERLAARPAHEPSVRAVAVRRSDAAFNVIGNMVGGVPVVKLLMSTIAEPIYRWHPGVILKARNRPRATVIDVAREAGVSTATVTRSLRESPLVTQATRERVVEIARQLGYTPNLTARELRGRNRAAAVGLVTAADQRLGTRTQRVGQSLVVSAPLVVGFLVLQRHITSGMTAGAVK